MSLLYHAYVYLEFLILACTNYILAPVLFCELSNTKNLECVTKDNYSCDYISFEVLNFTIQISNEKLAVALHKLSNKERDVILLRYFQSMSDQEIAELYHVSRSAIYRRRSNGLKKLKSILKERN